MMLPVDCKTPARIAALSSMGVLTRQYATAITGGVHTEDDKVANATGRFRQDSQFL